MTWELLLSFSLHIYIWNWKRPFYEPNGRILSFFQSLLSWNDERSIDLETSIIRKHIKKSHLIADEKNFNYFLYDLRAYRFDFLFYIQYFILQTHITNKSHFKLSGIKIYLFFYLSKKVTFLELFFFFLKEKKYHNNDPSEIAI